MSRKKFRFRLDKPGIRGKLSVEKGRESRQHKSMHGSLQYSLGDLVDRVTILTRKIFFGEEGAYKEHTYLTEAIEGLNLKLTGALLASIIRLTQMNFEIWNLENELRKGGEDFVDKVGFEEIGRRAVMIRDYNKKRIEYKNEINRLSCLGFREFKIKHRSQ